MDLLIVCSHIVVGTGGETADPAAPPAAPPKPHPRWRLRRIPQPPKAPESAGVSPDAAVITIPGLCEKPPVDKSKAATCKTVVTRAEFEQIVEAVAPNIAPGARKQLATQYGTALVMVHKAHQMGLDQGPKFQELMKVARVGVLTKELSQSLQEQAGHVTDKEVEDYYHNNEPAFQEADLQRIFIPRSKQSDDSKSKPGDEAAKQRQQESEDADEEGSRGAAGAGSVGRRFRQAPGGGRGRGGVQGQAAHQAGQGAAYQPAAHPGRSDGPEAGRGFATDFHSQRIPDLQGWGKRQPPPGQSAGRDCFHAALAAHASFDAGHPTVGHA